MPPSPGQMLWSGGLSDYCRIYQIWKNLLLPRAKADGVSIESKFEPELMKQVGQYYRLNLTINQSEWIINYSVNQWIINQQQSIINKSINVGWAPAGSPWEDWFLPTCCHSLHLQTSKAMQWGTPLLFLPIPVNQSQSISQLQSIIHSLHLQTSKAMRSTNHDWSKITMKMISSGIFCRSWFLQSMPTLPLPSLGSRSWTTTTASYISF